MDALPEFVKSVLTLACSSDRTLSWKIQEGEKGGDSGPVGVVGEAGGAALGLYFEEVGFSVQGA